jgi:hypothetical protein
MKRVKRVENKVQSGIEPALLVTGYYCNNVARLRWAGYLQRTCNNEITKDSQLSVSKVEGER